MGTSKSGNRDNRNKNPRLVTFGVIAVILSVLLALQYLQFSSSQNQINNLSSQVASLKSKNSNLESQNLSLTSQLINLENQLNLQKFNNSYLQSQNSQLQSSVNPLKALLNLSVATIEAYKINITQGPGKLSFVVDFKVPYAGYVLVSGTSSTPNATADLLYYGQYNYPVLGHVIGTSGSFIVAVLPGEITVQFGNYNTLDDATGTITVIYYS